MAVARRSCAKQRAELVLYFGLCRFGGTDDCARLQKTQRAENTYIGPDHKIRRGMVEFRGDNGTAHHHDGGVKRLPGVRHVNALAFWDSINIDPNHAIGESGELVEGQGIGGAAVYENAAVDNHRAK